MSFLKGNYKLEHEVAPNQEAASEDKLLEQEYYKTALSKLGGSIAFIMKDKTFLWTGDESDSSKADSSSKGGA